jgi:hypothetical protein
MRNSATPLSSWRLFDEMYAYIRRISKEILHVQYGARNISLSQETEKRPHRDRQVKSAPVSRERCWANSVTASRDKKQSGTPSGLDAHQLGPMSWRIQQC